MMKSRKFKVMSSDDHETNSLLPFGNYTYFKDELTGKHKKRKLMIEDIWLRLESILKTVKCCQGEIFHQIENSNKVIKCAKTAQFFALMHTFKNGVNWSDSTPNGITKAEMFHLALDKAEEYYDISDLPHFPKMEKVYYSNNIEALNTGKLDELLNFFTYASENDRCLVKAAFATAFWGGPPGSRPAFVIDGIEDDPQQNRGIGKTTLVDVVSMLAGEKFTDLSTKLDLEDCKKRLLSAESRIVRFDNIKTMKLSSEAIESLITSRFISGHKMHIGNTSRINLFTYFLTFNGASFSKDMAQRCILIRLKRPEKIAGWEMKIMNFIKENRTEIIQDIGFYLSKPDDKNFIPKTRFALWEVGVLSKFSNSDCIDEVVKRQGESDDDDKIRDDISDLFALKISEYLKDYQKNIDSSENAVLIAKSIAGKWINELLGVRASVRWANKVLSKNLPPQIKPDLYIRQGYQYWLWNPGKFENDEKFIPFDHFKEAYVIKNNNLRDVCRTSDISKKDT